MTSPSPPPRPDHFFLSNHVTDDDNNDDNNDDPFTSYNNDHNDPMMNTADFNNFHDHRNEYDYHHHHGDPYHDQYSNSNNRTNDSIDDDDDDDDALFADLGLLFEGGRETTLKHFEWDMTTTTTTTTSTLTDTAKEDNVEREHVGDEDNDGEKEKEENSNATTTTTTPETESDSVPNNDNDNNTSATTATTKTKTTTATIIKPIHVAVEVVDDEPGAVQSGHYLWPAAPGLCQFLVSSMSSAATEAAAAAAATSSSRAVGSPKRMSNVNKSKKGTMNSSSSPSTATTTTTMTVTTDEDNANATMLSIRSAGSQSTSTTVTATTVHTATWPHGTNDGGNINDNSNKDEREQQHNPNYQVPIAPQSILELGAGCALVSLTALQLYQRSLRCVVVTDHDPVTLDRARNNHETTLEELYERAETEDEQMDCINQVGSIPVEFKSLEWGQKETIHNIKALVYELSESSSYFDIVLGSDLIYCIEMIEPLFRTASQLMKTNHSIFYLSQSFPLDDETEKEITYQCQQYNLQRVIVKDFYENIHSINDMTADTTTPNGVNCGNGIMIQQFRKG